MNERSNSKLMHWQINCSDRCTSLTIGFSERLMSGIMLNYKLLFEGFTLLQLQLFPAIMVVLRRRSSESISILLTDVPLRCGQKCWFRDFTKVLCKHVVIALIYKGEWARACCCCPAAWSFTLTMGTKLAHIPAGKTDTCCCCCFWSKFSSRSIGLYNIQSDAFDDKRLTWCVTHERAMKWMCLVKMLLRLPTLIALVIVLI